MKTPSRRSMLFAAVAGVFAGVAGKLFAASPKGQTVTRGFTVRGLAKDDGFPVTITIPRDPEDASLGPGKTHFHAALCPLPCGKRLYFNGVDWTCRSVECDTKNGWVIAYPATPDGIGNWKIDYPDGWLEYRKHHGKVEVR